jgi:glycosyltransferase involved in cell wall biosynthesis
VSEVSLCIATYNNPEGCYLTLFAALEQLQKSQLDWEIVIVADGGTEYKYEQAHSNIRVFRYGGGNRLGSPQRTRDIGIKNCRYSNVLCVDSHVIISDIQSWVHEHKRLNAALSFPAMVGGSLEMWKLYGSVFDWDSFWYKHVLYKPKQEEPYRILETSHSGFMVDRDWYLESGGYTDLQVGYGGEETFLGMKAWMTGRQNWLIPSVNHAHYQPQGRNQDAELTDNYKRNFLVAAYVFGGHEYLTKVQAHYKCPLKITMEIEKERQKICAGPFQGDLNLLRDYLTREGIE